MNICDDEWTTCPYDPAHRVPRVRIQYHIIKCQKNKPSLEVCPYNATHRYPSDEIKYHCQNCPQKPIEDVQITKNNNCGMITTPKPILQREYLPENDPDNEDWDD